MACALTLLLASGPLARGATSAITDAFVAETSRDVAVLHQSDLLAIADSASNGLRAFARRDSLDQSAAYRNLMAWAQAERRAAQAAALAPTIDGLGPILYPFDAGLVPLNVDGPAANRVDLAILEQLRRLRGRDFADVYIPAQSAALARLQDAYVDYIKNGDDPRLRELAVRNLPRVRALLSELRRL